MKIYFAAPLFCKSERDFNINLTKQLEELGYEVFLPQRDGACVELDIAYTHKYLTKSTKLLIGLHTDISLN